MRLRQKRNVFLEIYNMKDNKDCCYEEMTKGVGGQSMPSEYHDEPMINSYENKRKSFMGDKGFDWSGMEK